MIAGGYLLLTLAAASPLVQEGYIGHGNGLSFLLAMALTFPLSVILFLLNDLFFDVNAFYMTGWPYFITLCELGASALLNARCSTCWTHSSGGSGTTRDSGVRR